MDASSVEATDHPVPRDERIDTARRVVLESALLGVVADSALRAAPNGLGWTLFVVTLALAALNIARRREAGVAREQLAWLGAAVACSVAFAWRDAEDLRLFNVLGTLVSLAMFAMSASGLPATSILTARLRDVFVGGLFTIRDMLVGAPSLVFGDAKLHTVSAIRGGASWTAVRALVLTAPLVLIFAALFSQADPVFASIFAFPHIDAEWIVSHAFLTGLFAWLSAGLIRGALLGVAPRRTVPDGVGFRLGTVEITTALGAVIALCAIFVIIQLRWLFGGAQVVLATTGLTVAEYARRGFFELVAVTALTVPVILGTRATLATDDARATRLHARLSLGLIALLVPIIASALMRMRLYVDYFGLSTDRIYATAIMGWLALVFIAMAMTVLRGWSRPFAAMTVLSGFATLLVMNAMNPELLVARTNLARSSARQDVDLAYLARLSGDATPTLVRALRSSAPSPSACEAAKMLQRRWIGDEVSWNLGAYRGWRAVMDQLPSSEVTRLCVLGDGHSKG